MKHGMSKSKIYRVWIYMRKRCQNSNDTQFRFYGGRGISVCDRWANSFEEFHKDMGDIPIGMTLERVDNDGNYFKDNCVWATRLEQSRNRRIPKRNTSGIRGVCWAKSSNKWQAALSLNSKLKYLGQYMDKKDAEVAHLRHYYGFYGKFPPEYKGRLF